MTQAELDAVLISTYKEFNTPADRFAGNVELSDQFLSIIKGKLGVPGLDSKEVFHRLLNLRRVGKLPRLRRNYFGRN